MLTKLLTATATMCFTALIAIPAQAHDFWISATDYTLDAPQTAQLSMMVGHPEDRTHWPLISHRVVGFRGYGPDGITDYQSRVMPDAMTKRIDAPLTTPGTHIITIETTHATSILEPEKFQSYLDEEGLTPIRIERKLRDTEDAPGHEIYSRRGKALIQVGPYTGAQDAMVVKPLGLTLEVTPLVNPYSLEAGDDFPVQVHYRGEIAGGVTVAIINLDDDSGIAQKFVTDQDGKAVFTRPKEGNWMIHAVWSAPLPDSQEADFDTTFSSLSFGF